MKDLTKNSNHYVLNRKEELLLAQTLLDKVKRSLKQTLFISGSAGIGKTFFFELFKSQFSEHCLVVRGKFEQFNRNVAYSALTQILSNICHYLLLQNPENSMQYKKKILAILGNESQILINLVSELKYFLETPDLREQPNVIELDPVASRHRFETVLCQFLKIFTEDRRPLILFIDDLQWADQASLLAIKAILEFDSFKALFFIGAYRDDELTLCPDLFMSLLHEQKAAYHRKLKPFAEQDICRWLNREEIFNKKRRKMVQLILRKTEGNPFFIQNYLETIRKNPELILSEESHQSILSLILLKLNRFSFSVKKYLSIAACCGYSFHIDLLIGVSGKTKIEVRKILQSAIKEEFIIEQQQDIYHFKHDYIQQTIYQKISKKKRKEYHAQIGRFLLKDLEIFTRKSK